MSCSTIFPDEFLSAHAGLNILNKIKKFLLFNQGGESGVPLKLQIDIHDAKSQNVAPLYSAGCQIKVFRVGYKMEGQKRTPHYLHGMVLPLCSTVYLLRVMLPVRGLMNISHVFLFSCIKTKGADRKHKTELSKLEQLSQEEMVRYLKIRHVLLWGTHGDGEKHA